MADPISLPAIPIVLGTALADSVNPCAIGVLILLLATLLKLSKKRNKMLVVGTIYIAVVFITYLAAGFGLLFFIQKLYIAEELSLLVGVFIMILGLLEIKDFFWYGKGLSLRIPAKRAKQIQKYIKHVTIPGSILLGIFVAAVELPCTGGPYLAITTLLAKIGFSWKVFWLLILYNFIFVLPLIIILSLFYFGVRALSIQKWKERYKKLMRLIIGIVLIIMGFLLILSALGFFIFG